MTRHSDVTPRGKSVEIINAAGLGPAVILCEHASNYIPERYRNLGLSQDARNGHAAWDPHEPRGRMHPP